MLFPRLFKMKRAITPTLFPEGIETVLKRFAVNFRNTFMAVSICYRSLAAIQILTRARMPHCQSLSDSESSFEIIASMFQNKAKGDSITKYTISGLSCPFLNEVSSHQLISRFFWGVSLIFHNHFKGIGLCCLG